MTGAASGETCPLCESNLPVAAEFLLSHPRPRRARFCPNCFLVAVAPEDQPDPAAERERYLLHRNEAGNEGYVRFLERLLVPVFERVAPGSRGCDYGCGPEPVLARLAEKCGLICDVFDPFFHPRALEPPYDFLLASEVLEHLRRPGEELARMHALLRPGGILGVMTERWSRLEDFESWPYTTDPTHLGFYHAHTLDWIAHRFGLELLFDDGRRVTVHRAPPRPTRPETPPG